MSSSPSCCRCCLELPLAPAGERPTIAELAPLAGAPIGIAELYSHRAYREPALHLCGACERDLASSW